MELESFPAREAIRKVCGFFGGNATEVSKMLRLHKSVVIGRRSGARNFTKESAILYGVLVIYAAQNDKLRELVGELPEGLSIDALNERLAFPECLRDLMENASKLIAGEITAEEIQITRRDTKSILDAFSRNRDLEALICGTEEPGILIESKELPECPVVFVPLRLNPTLGDKPK
jgi:hypothetical protein